MMKNRSGIAVVLGVAALLATSRDSWANDTCTGAGKKYDCTNPVTTGCSATAITVCSSPIKSATGAVIGTVQLRYSTSCQTVWTRTISNVGTTPLKSGIHRWLVTDGESRNGVAEARDTSTSNYTLQLYDGVGYHSYGVGTVKNHEHATCSF